MRSHFARERTRRAVRNALDCAALTVITGVLAVGGKALGGYISIPDNDSLLAVSQWMSRGILGVIYVGSGILMPFLALGTIALTAAAAFTALSR